MIRIIQKFTYLNFLKFQIQFDQFITARRRYIHP